MLTRFTRIVHRDTGNIRQINGRGLTSLNNLRCNTEFKMHGNYNNNEYNEY